MRNERDTVVEMTESDSRNPPQSSNSHQTGPDLTPTTDQNEKMGCVDMATNHPASPHASPPDSSPHFIISSNSNQEDLESRATAIDSETYPEGGLQAWLVVLGSWMALVTSLGLMNCLAIFQAYVATNQLKDYDEGTVGWIFSIYTFMVFFAGLYIGPLFDKYGPGWLILSGNLTVTASLMLFSFSTEIWHFIVSFGLFCGLGCSLLFTPSLAAVGHFFHARRGLATGIAITGGSIGGIIFPLMLESLFGRLGWGWAIRILAFICLALGTGANLLVRSRLVPSPDISTRPHLGIFTELAFALTTVGIFLLEFAFFVPLTYISLYARAQGFDTTFSFRIPPILNTASAAGRALPGYWGDVVGPFNVNLVMTMLSTVACLAIWLPAGSHKAGLILFAVTFGFASGSNTSITPVCIGRLCRTQQYGRYYATCYTVASIACLVGVPIGGRMLTSNKGDYWGVIVFTGIMYLGAFVFLYMAKVCKVGWRPWVVF